MRELLALISSLLLVCAARRDWFDKLSLITYGGISKSSAQINLSEDIFGGLNFVGRGGRSSQSDFVQVGKGKDVGLAQVCSFNLKISMGNAEQMLSRDFWRLATQFDPMRQFSLFYSSTGHFLNQVIVMCALFIQLYIMCFLVFSGIQQALDIDEDESADQPATPASEQVRRLYVTFFGVNVFQVSALQLIASGVNLVVEYGPARGVSTLVAQLCRGSFLFYGFMAAAKGSGVHNNIVYRQGGCEY